MTRRLLAVLAAAALVPELCFVLFGYGGHDFTFHVATWMELRTSWLSGNLHPGWAPLSNFGLGDAHFGYYPPFSFNLAALLSLLLPLRFVPGAMVWLAVFVAGLSMFACSAAFVGERDRLKLALLYALNPYLLTTALVRFAIGELLVQAWLPLIILSVQRALFVTDPQKARRAVFVLAALLGLTWLTNIPASIVLAYVLGGGCLGLSLRRRSFVPVATFAVAEASAVGLAAFHHLPAFVERHWISAGHLLKMDLWFMVLPVRTSGKLFATNAVLLTWIGVSVIAVAWLLAKAESRARTPALGFLVGMALLAFVFQLPVSAWGWEHLPFLSFVQFPMRFLTAIYVFVPIVALALPLRRPWQSILVTGLLSLALVPMLIDGHMHKWGAASERTSDVLDAMQHGYAGQPEYWPVTKSDLPRRAAEAALPHVEVSALSYKESCKVKELRWSAEEHVVETLASTPCQLRFATFYHPHWRAMLDDGTALEVSHGDQGQLTTTVPAGGHAVTLTFRAESQARTLGAWITLLTLFTLGVLRWRERAPRRDDAAVSTETAAVV